MIQLYDVAPDGTAVRFDEQVALLRPDEMDVELRSTGWALATGHALAVEIGTVQPRTGPLDPPLGIERVTPQPPTRGMNPPLGSRLSR